jgi:uncharacterized iron-regulated protein
MPPSSLVLLPLAGLLAAGCAPRALTPGPLDPRPYGPDWSAPLQRDHPLAGRILDVDGRRWIDQAGLDAALARADIAVLGEVHDNPDHHRLQAREVRAVVAAGRRPALAFEMLSTPAQEPLDAALAGGGATADSVAEAVAWSKSGWPDFASYRPIFEAGLQARLPLVAANLSRAAARVLMKQGVESLPAEVRAWLARAPEPSAKELEQLRREMAEDHCGELPEAMVKPLVKAQRARDAMLAVQTAAAAANGRGAILVAGDGHARRDRGVPAWLVRELPGTRVMAVGHLEVQADLRHPDDYAAEYGGGLPFDFVIFTPAAEREDPCLELKKRMDEKKAGRAAP